MSTSTREMRREEYSTNVIRTLQPSRPMSPYSQKSDFDNNILDDLQQSISRPGSSLGQPMTNYSSHREIQYAQPANSTTVLRERSLSPNSSTNRVYKTTKYEYSTSNTGSGHSNYGHTSERGNINEINKLDTLLNDLEIERTATLERNKRISSNNVGIDSGLLEPGTKVIKTTTTYTSKNPVSRELIFDSPEQSTINRSSIRHQSPSYETRTIDSVSSSTKRNVTYTDDGLYGRPRPAQTPANNTQYHVTESRTRTISPTPVSNNNNTERYITETRTINNNEVVPVNPKNSNYNEIVRVEQGPEVLRDIHLSNDILPRPKTKVTTTIRTYTYEIPEDGSAPIVHADRDPPKSNAMFYKTERNERSVNYYPNETSPSANYPPLTIQEVPPPSQHTTTVYKYSTNTNSSSQSPQQQQPVQPIQPHNGNIPPGGITIYPPNQTTIYKTETINTTNKQYRSPTPSHGPQYPSDNYNNYPPTQHTHGSPYPNHHHPNEPSVVVYKQTTTTNTRNVSGRPPHEPHLHPFPVDGPVITEVDGSPPKRVEDLMASFGDTSEIHYTNKKVQIAEKPLTPTNQHNLSSTTTKVYTSETDDKNKNAVVPSKNIAGPPVYYPPNHELFTSKEESGAAYRAQGGWARGSGKYMYESESKSKSSSKSGAAVVPLCCPLCCAMPCTIM
ncbi:hypothetical protein PVAND_000775 [Polypedilum vanderplanki]|uniref:Uncharacterized protein n=1 Tax=Polypedilum vanderplanki TaxID=319348 RepID=A0A9J6BL75_POLVA|nr:hypothetical protein PVAND_000775 [Polypedilum vanderplanki]